MTIEEYLQERYGKQLCPKDIVLFDTWGLMAIFEKYEHGKTAIKSTMLQSKTLDFNTYEFLSMQLHRRELVFCYAPMTECELKEISVTRISEKNHDVNNESFLKRTAASSALAELYKFKKTTDLTRLSQVEQRKRFAILEPACTWLEKIGEKNDSSILHEIGITHIDWLVSGDCHILNKNVIEPLKKLGVTILNPKELDGILSKVIEKIEEARVQGLG